MGQQGHAASWPTLLPSEDALALLLVQACPLKDVQVSFDVGGAGLDGRRGTRVPTICCCSQIYLLVCMKATFDTFSHCSRSLLQCPCQQKILSGVLRCQAWGLRQIGHRGLLPVHSRDTETTASPHWHQLLHCEDTTTGTLHPQQ